jgi:hypothetical protein
MLNEWLDLQKNEVVPALKKGGIKSQTVYATTLFGDGFEYSTITPFGKFAEFDDQAPVVKALGAAAAARLGEKIRKCIVSTTSYVITRQDDLSNVPDGATLDRSVAPGKMNDYLNLVKTEVTPAFKKAKITLVVNRRGLGTNANDLNFTTPLDKYAELDGPSPFLKALGQDALTKLGPRLASMSAGFETIVRTRQADLSF